MKENGFTLIELLISIALAALFIPALVFVLSFSLGSASQGENYTQAYAIAQENMEAIYYLKEYGAGSWDWTTTPANTGSDEYYQPQKSGNTWVLGPINPPLAEVDGYTATVQILAVSREDFDGDSISETIVESCGELPSPSIYCGVDDSTRKIIVNVSWKENGQPTNVELVSYVSKH